MYPLQAQLSSSPSSSPSRSLNPPCCMRFCGQKVGSECFEDEEGSQESYKRGLVARSRVWASAKPPLNQRHSVFFRAQRIRNHRPIWNSEAGWTDVQGYPLSRKTISVKTTYPDLNVGIHHSSAKPIADQLPSTAIANITTVDGHQAYP